MPGLYVPGRGRQADGPERVEVDWGHPINRRLRGWWPFNQSERYEPFEVVTKGQMIKDPAALSYNIRNLETDRGWVMWGNSNGVGYLKTETSNYWAVSAGQAYTFSAWVQNGTGDNDSGWERVFSVPGGSIGMTVLGNSFGGGSWFVGSESTGAERASIGATGDGIWDHVVVRGTWEDSGTEISKNGLTASATQSSDAAGSGSTGSTAFWFFQTASNQGRRYHGKVQNCRFWDRILEDGEVIELYHNPWVGHKDFFWQPALNIQAAAAGGLSIPVAMRYYRNRRVA